jgi:hypothetical protein
MTSTGHKDHIMNYRTIFPIILVPVAALTALLLAPTASADSTSYVNDIYGSSYGFYGPASDYMSLGNGVCSLVSQGFNQNAITNWVVRNSGPGIFAAQAQYIMISAEVYLC